jgi:hypothetical protein
MEYKDFAELASLLLWLAIASPPSIPSFSPHATARSQPIISAIATIPSTKGKYKKMAWAYRFPMQSARKNEGASHPHLRHSASEIGTLPSEIGILPSEIGILPSEIGILPSETGILPSEVETLPSETGILPSEVETLLFEIGTSPSELQCLG